jgi:hypothetical protein
MFVPDVNICAKCNKEIYPVEEWKYLDKTWHKMCVKCTVSDMVLDINNNKRFEKMPNSDNRVIRRESDDPIVSAQTKKILIYGSTGVGKSSLIKLVTGIQTIDSVCTTFGSSHEFNFETEFSEFNRETSTESEIIGDSTFYDTSGLNGPQTGIVPHSVAIRHLFNLIKSLRNGLNLLIYVRRIRPLSTIDAQNIKLIKFLMKDKVPLICVNTGCENNMNWWEEEKNNANITQFILKDGCSVCCIDISKLNNDEDKEFYIKKLKQSKQILLEKIKANLLREPYIFYRDSKWSEL